MILKYHQLVGIKAGTISLAFRRWEKSNVKKGGTMKNEMGVIRIDDVEEIPEKSITEKDAVKAGFEDRDSLLKELNKRGEGKIFKIKLSYHSEDPRIELREKTSLSDEDFKKIETKLERLDKTGGPWVMKTLKLIDKHPERRAGDLADIMRMEKFDFKLRVRKLKNLGLTRSHEIGYTISPLGNLVLERMVEHDKA